MINDYFKEYTKSYHNMKRALKKYIDAKSDFHNLTGVKYDDMPKAKGKSLGFDDIMIRIEELYDKYILELKKYDDLRDKCINDINKLDNPIHRAILEYFYLDFECIKEVAYSLKEFHDKDYSLAYIRELKSNAVSLFEQNVM